jgi:hypothetical protein
MMMIRQQSRVVDGQQVGTWTVRFDGEWMRVSSPTEEKPFWKKLFR